MDFNEIINTLIQNIANTSWLEIIAVVFGILSVWLAKKANILLYPTGIISVLIYVYLCYFAGLYADMGINGVYFIMSIYGWIMWAKKGGEQESRPISVCKVKHHLLNILIFVVSFIFLYYLLKNHTDSNVPLWDALTTAMFIVAMLLMALKKIEHWIVWIIGDAISIPLYFYKDLVFTSLQFTIFLILAILGYIEWHRILKKEKRIA